MSAVPLPPTPPVSLPPPPGPAHPHAPGRLARQMVVGLVLLTAGIGAIAYALEPWIVWVGELFVGAFGMPGVFIGVLLTDTFFLANEPILGIAYAGGLPFWPVAAVACVASILAGLVGWVLGRQLGHHPWVRRLIERNQLDALLARWGVWAVAVAALSPVPYGAATWAAGAARVHPWVVFLGSLLRIPRVLIYFWLVVQVWHQVVGP